MPSAQECAARIKASYRSVVEEPPADLDMRSYNWFRPAVEGRCIPLVDIARRADKEYETWRRIEEPLIEHSCDSTQRLKDWIEHTLEEDLARMIDTTPRGVSSTAQQAAFEFTPYQRLSMLIFVTAPFATTSKITVDTDSLRAIAYDPRVGGSGKRKLPIQTQFSLQKGEPPDVAIIDLPTGAGKTAWSLCVLFLMMAPLHFPRLSRSHHRKMLGQVHEGDLLMIIARLSIVAVGPTVFAHFVNTLNRLLPRMQELLPAGFKINVWSKMSKHYSLKAAADASEDTMTFWVMTPDKVNQVRRESPSIAILGCLVDEFTQDKPAVRSRTDMSPVLKQMINQATPHRLTAATGGNSYLRDFFGGQLWESAGNLRSSIARHDFKNAYIISQQMCKLDLVTLTAFRNPVRADLCRLMPSSLQVEFVRARRQTLASYLVGTRTDVGPISMATAVCAMIQDRQYRLRPYTRAKIEQIFKDAFLNMADLFTALLSVTDEAGRPIPPASIERLKQRYQDFVLDGCPICMCDKSVEDLRFCGACGYALCSDCVPRCARCPFCRKAMQYANPTDDSAIPADDDYSVEITFPSSMPLKNVLRSITQANHKQVTATTLALHAVLRAGYKRLLILVHRPVWTARAHINPISIERLQAVCGIRIFDADLFLHGKGSRFELMKAEFDAVDDQPKAFMCFSNPEFMVGTDLCTTDCILTSGTVDEDILTQSIGRAIRPHPNRDPDKPLLMVTIHV